MSLRGKTVLVASGPTFAPLDDVRSITNRSSGRLGSTIAYTLMKHHAEVFFLYGETSLTPSVMYAEDDVSPIHEFSFRTVTDLHNSIRHALTCFPVDVVIMAAAVLDYIPVSPVKGKKQSDEEEWIIRLKRCEKIIEKIKSWAPDVFLVGFKLESDCSKDELIQRSLHLIHRCKAQLVVANLIQNVGPEQHTAFFVEKGIQDEEGNDSIQLSPSYQSREAIAEALADKLMERLPS